MKKHDAFEVDLTVHNNRCAEIADYGQKLISSGNHHSPVIKARMQQLQARLDALIDLARRRFQRLLDNSAYLQFMWKCDVVENWIGKTNFFGSFDSKNSYFDECLGEKESHVRSDDFGRDLSSVQILLTKQEAFDAGLNAFEHEGIQRITELKDQLVSSKHAQTPAIQERHANVMARWQRLLKNSAERRSKLLKMQEQYKRV